MKGEKWGRGRNMMEGGKEGEIGWKVRREEEGGNKVEREEGSEVAR